MEWIKMKTKGITPAPRSGHAGILIGDKWYIAGGETRGRGEFMAFFFFLSHILKSALYSVLTKNRLFVLLCMLRRLDRNINA